MREQDPWAGSQLARTSVNSQIVAWVHSGSYQASGTTEAGRGKGWGGQLKYLWPLEAVLNQ